METKNSFNEMFRVRTRNFSVVICKTFAGLTQNEAAKVVTRQILRSGTSVGANFRAACRARSSAEYYSKLCIVVEECDETLFWLDLISQILPGKREQFQQIEKEATELLSVFSTTRKKLKIRLSGKKEF